MTRPSISVKSAMLPPSSVPRPMPGFPSNAEMTAMNISGSDETNAMTIKLVVNSVSLSHRARCDTDLTAYSALFTSRMQPMMNMSTSLYMCLLCDCYIIKIFFHNTYIRNCTRLSL